MGYIITKGSPERMKAVKKKLLVYLILGVSFLGVTVWIMIVNPVILLAKYYARIDYGTFVHEALSRETDSVHISAYLFNVTNADQFKSGEDTKLKVQEIGPFTYQENRTNEDLEIDTAAGVMRYTPRLKTTFLPEESIGRPEDFIVTMPNLAMLSMASTVTNYGYLGKMGFNMLITKLRSKPIVQMSAADYLWGYDEPLIKLSNQIMPGWINFDTLGILDRLYDKNATFRLEVSAREDDKFMIKTVNGVGGLSAWGYPETSTACNSFEGSFEGLGYPPEMSPDRPLKIYRNVLCRFMELEYLGSRTMDFGVEGMAYKFSNKSYSKIPENECLCNKGICYDGVSDLSPCFYGLPVVMSHAHFLDANPLIYERIEGMTPNEEQHGSGFTIEPIIGMVMTTKFSVQVNVMMKDVGFNAEISKFSDMIVPIAYFKVLQPRMQEEQIAALRSLHMYGPYIVLGIRLGLLLISLLFLSLSARLLYFTWIYSRRKQIAFNSDIVDVKRILSTEPLMNRC